MNIKVKAVESSNDLAKIKTTMIFFKQSATQSLCSTVGSKANNGTEVGIAARIVLHFLYLHCYKVLVGKLVCQTTIKDKQQNHYKPINIAIEKMLKKKVEKRICFLFLYNILCLKTLKTIFSGDLQSLSCSCHNRFPYRILLKQNKLRVTW